MRLGTYSFGTGDRFGRQGAAQLGAVRDAVDAGAAVVPVWNKSHREHAIIGSSPGDVRREADAAVRELGWVGSYYVDADHVKLDTVELFMEASDFFTLDVADYTGTPAPAEEIRRFVDGARRYAGSLSLPMASRSLEITAEQIERIAEKYLRAVMEAGNIYRRIAEVKGEDHFVAEVSMDETDRPQTPVELLFILLAVAGENIRAQTIAPKFSGRFNKGVDYAGEVDDFAREFDDDLSVIAFAVEEFGLPDNLKLSVHSGSDKFAIYPVINRLLEKHDAGLHLKTAGTTWLEEVAGLAEAGGGGLAIAAEIYDRAMARFDELCEPYAPVIDIDRSNLPDPASVKGWSGADVVAALEHNQSCPAYNRDFRQLVHVAYKIAAEMGDRFTDALVENRETIARRVRENIRDRHLLPLFRR